MKNLLLAVTVATAAGLAGCSPAAEPVGDAPIPLVTDAAAPAIGVASGMPELPARGASAAAFVPAGWRLEQAVEGDISGDGVPDLAFVLRRGDPQLIIRREGLPDSDINPRILAVALGGAGGFRLAGQNHAIFPERDADMLHMDDPFDAGLSVANGVLTLELNLFMSMGGSSTGPYQFHFREQDGAVKLIGYNHTNVERMSGEMNAVSVNFLTGRRTDTAGRIDSERETTVVSRTTVKPIPLDQIGDGFAFEYDQLTPPTP
tara:strand:+ start:3587 stop:4369 length:783 start_codon:yes stop_codon:yes gene_type:complete